MKLLFSLLLAFAIYSCSNEKKDNTQKEDKKDGTVITIDSLLLTDTSWGPITGKTDFAGLQAIYGEANVKKARICGPECVDSIDVVLVYPETDKEIIVYWTDSTYKKIGSLENRSPKSPYYTSAGIRSGSTMEDLLKVNGQKISFAGFGWDYGGYIQSFNNGTLDKSKVHYRLDLLEGGSEKLLGDIELTTDMPDVKKDLAKIQVWQIALLLNE